MSQKKEKYARSLARRMELLEARVWDIPWQSPGPDRRLSAARRRASRAEGDAAIWRVVAIAALLAAAAIILLAAFAMRPDAEPPAPDSAESLPTVRVLAPLELPAEDREAQVMPWAHRLEDCTVTYYDVCVECCGKTDGITYSGTQAIPYETCAVDPEVIPLGSTVTVDYGDGLLRQYRAEDVGGTVKGAHVDICVASHEESVELGRRTAVVYWVALE